MGQLSCLSFIRIMTITTLPFGHIPQGQNGTLIFAKAFRNVGPKTSLWNPYLKKAMSTLQKIKILIVQQIHFT